MRSVKSIGFVAVITLCFMAALVVPRVRADDWDKKTKVTFNEAV